MACDPQEALLSRKEKYAPARGSLQGKLTQVVSMPMKTVSGPTGLNRPLGPLHYDLRHRAGLNPVLPPGKPGSNLELQQLTRHGSHLLSPVRNG